MRPGGRHDCTTTRPGEGSIFPYKNGRYAGYVWVSTLGGERRRKYVYGDAREQVHARWVELHRSAARGPLVTRTPTLGEYLTRWQRDVVAPFASPKTAENYAAHVRLYITPRLGERRLAGRAERVGCAWLAAAAVDHVPVLCPGQGCWPTRHTAALLRGRALLRAAVVPPLCVGHSRHAPLGARRRRR